MKIKKKVKKPIKGMKIKKSKSKKILAGVSLPTPHRYKVTFATYITASKPTKAAAVVHELYGSLVDMISITELTQREVKDAKGKVEINSQINQRLKDRKEGKVQA